MKNTERDNSIGYLVWKLSNAARVELEAQLGEIELTVAQMGAVGALHADPSQSTADLARELYLTPQNLSLVVSKLEREGHLERRPHETNRRIHKLVLTTRGRGTMERAITRAIRVDKCMTATLSAAERTLLAKLLHKCLRAMEAGRAEHKLHAATCQKRPAISSRRKRG